MYKSFFYLYILSFFAGKNYLNQMILRKILNLLLVFFFLKYSLMKILGLGFQGRPDLFVENNFELIMLLIIYIGVYSRELKINKWDIFVLSIIFVLSAILSFLIMLFFLDFGRSKKLKTIKVFLLIIVFFGFLLIFVQRLGNTSFEDIDRIKFFYYFLNEIKLWDIKNYLFGASFMKLQVL